MLTQEGFVAGNMSSRPSSLQRSSWKAEAIRRGDLKISGPIPIAEEAPVGESPEEQQEEEVAGTSSVAGSSVPQDEQRESVERPKTSPQSQNRSLHVPEGPKAQVPEHVIHGDNSTQSENIHDPPPPRHQPQVQQGRNTQRESMTQHASTVPSTPYRSTPESTMQAAQRKKRKSGIRNVFRKMFGRKGREEPEEPVAQPTPRGHSYHRSDPGMLKPSPLRMSPPGEDQSANRSRISELPVEELKPLHPLGQHLPFPMNVNAPQATPPEQYITFEMQRPDSGRRRATLPSLPRFSIQRLSLEEARHRMSSWDDSKDDELIPSPEIGIALSSPTQALTPLASKRRSRSADALHELTKGRASMERRRSAEIRYWRESHASGSVYSSLPRPQTARTVDSVRTVQIQEPDAIVEMSATLVHPDEEEELEVDGEHGLSHGQDRGQNDEDRKVEPTSTFNFGNLDGQIADDTSIDLDRPATPPRSGKRLSIEDRIQHLERHFESLDSTVRRITTHHNRRTVIISPAPKTLRSRTSRTSQSSSISSTPAPTTPQRASPSHSIHHHHDHANFPSPTPLPASPPLIRPSTAPATNADRDAALDKLHEALAHERAARKALQHQVLSLHHDIADLHALVTKLMSISVGAAASPNYPTPSPDALVLEHGDGGGRRTPRPGGRRMRGMGGSENERRELDGYEDDTETEEETDVDVLSPGVEEWVTPKEDAFHPAEFWGEGRRRGETFV